MDPVEKSLDPRPVRVGPIGLVLPTFPQRLPVTAEAVLSTARRAEEAGVGTLWASDHLFWHGPSLECFTALALAATVTERAALGSAVLQLPLRNPAAVAKSAASLQVVSQGRLILGVGNGIHEGEYVAAGVPFRGRGRALDEGIAAVRRIWERVDAEYPQLPAPPAIPIWVGGSSPAARRRAAALADGWLPMLLGPEGLAEAYERLDQDLAAVGRPRDAVTRAAVVFVSVGAGEEARERGLDWMSSLWRVPAARVARHVVSGEPEAIAGHLRRMAEAGAEHIAILMTDDDPIRQLDALGAVTEEVLT